MKDVTSTSFGYVIAYVLPGGAALYAISFFFEWIRGIFERFEEARSDLGIATLVLLATILTGLQVSMVRQFVFECCLARAAMKRYRNAAKKGFREISGNEGRLVAFRASVDEYYRYHQFWGGIALVTPIGALAWCVTTPRSMSEILVAAGIGTVLTFLSSCTAIESLQKMAERLEAMIEGAVDGEEEDNAKESHKESGAQEGKT